MKLNDPKGHRRDAIYVAVVGPDDYAEIDDIEVAMKVGYELARRGAVLVCGGLGGVMRAACEGVYVSNKENKAQVRALIGG